MDKLPKLKTRSLTKEEVEDILTWIEISHRDWQEFAETEKDELSAKCGAARASQVKTIHGWFEDIFGTKGARK